MKKSKFTEEQIAYALKQAELGTPVAEVCRKMGISDATFSCCQKMHGPPRLCKASVVAALTRLAQHRPLPRYIKADYGSEFISKVLDKWAYENGVEIDFSRPGKPTDNAKNESSTDASGRNASTHIGSCLSRMPDARSKSGASL